MTKAAGSVKADGGILSGWTIKYFAKIAAAQARSERDDPSAEGAFDFENLGADRYWSPVTRRFWLWSLRVAFALFRTFWPLPKFRRLIIVTRDRDVRDVLSKPATFGVPYGPEMAELGGGGETFVLGLDGEAQKRQHQLIRSIIHDEDVTWLIRRSREIADTLINAAGGRIDVMKDLITRVAAETCVEFFGLRVDDPDAFAEWAMSISALLFADPFGNPKTRQLALAGAARVRSAIDAATTRLSVNRPAPPDGLHSTILERLIDAGISPGEVRSIMVGMVTGFIPTTTLAAGNIIEELLRERDGFEKPMAAACRMRGGDASAREELKQLLFGAARLNPALNPGQWRHAREDCTVGTKAAASARHVPKGINFAGFDGLGDAVTAKTQATSSFSGGAFMPASERCSRWRRPPRSSGPCSQSKDCASVAAGGGVFSE